MPSNSFPFIVSNGPKLQHDPSVRTMIRKQAMKDVGNARRKRRKSARDAAAQQLARDDTTTTTPNRSTSSSDDTFESSSSDTSGGVGLADEGREYDELLPLLSEHDYPPLLASPMPLSSSYEVARARFQVDVTDLSMLTNFNVGRGVIAVLGAEPSNLATLLGSRTWSYMEYVPSRYGISDCLTAATDCVLGKVRSILAPQEFDKERMLRLYAKALQTLQDAISDESKCMEADVLCATELLSLHELLDPGRQSAWDQHIEGSMHLVRSRTPARFQTEFEKALFAAQVGPSISAAFLSNSACYVATPEWAALFHSLAVESNNLTDRSPLTIKIRSIMIVLPGLWQEVDSAVKSDTLFNDSALESLADRCRKIQRDILDWTEDYKNRCVRLSLAVPSANELAMRRELFGLSLECLVVFKRLLATVSDHEREELEVQAQACSRLLLDLQDQPSSKHSWLFAGHEVGVAYTVQFTKEQWEGPFSYASDFERKIACRTRYTTWSDMIRSSE